MCIRDRIILIIIIINFGRTSYKAKHWGYSARDSVDTSVEALVWKLSLEVAGQQGVGDRPHRLLGATSILGLHLGIGEEE